MSILAVLELLVTARTSGAASDLNQFAGQASRAGRDVERGFDRMRSSAQRADRELASAVAGQERALERLQSAHKRAEAAERRIGSANLVTAKQSERVRQLAHDEIAAQKAVSAAVKASSALQIAAAQKVADARDGLSAKKAAEFAAAGRIAAAVDAETAAYSNLTRASEASAASIVKADNAKTAATRKRIAALEAEKAALSDLARAQATQVAPNRSAFVQSTGVKSAESNLSKKRLAEQAAVGATDKALAAQTSVAKTLQAEVDRQRSVAPVSAVAGKRDAEKLARLEDKYAKSVDRVTRSTELASIATKDRIVAEDRLAQSRLGSTAADDGVVSAQRKATAATAARQQAEQSQAAATKEAAGARLAAAAADDAAIARATAAQAGLASARRSAVDASRAVAKAERGIADAVAAASAVPDASAVKVADARLKLIGVTNQLRIAEGSLAQAELSVAVAEGDAAIAADNLTRARARADASAFNVADAQAAQTASKGQASRVALQRTVLGVAAAYVAGATALFSFEEKMRNVNSLQVSAAETSAESEARFRAQSKAVLELSRVVPRSANDLAEGLYEINSAGFAGAEGLRVLEQAGRVAVAGVASTDIAATALVATLRAYGLGVDSVTDVSDVLFKTVDFGIIRFDQLATALTYTTNIAASAGVSYSELGAALAAITRAGVPGAKSGVLLQNVIAKLIGPSKELNQVFINQTGLGAAATLRTYGLAKALDVVRRATQGDAEATKALFGDLRAVRGVLALTADDGKILADALYEVDNASQRAGATQRTFAEQMKASKNQVSVNINAIKADLITFAQGSGAAATAATGAIGLLTGAFAAARVPILGLSAAIGTKLAFDALRASQAVRFLATNMAAARSAGLAMSASIGATTTATLAALGPYAAAAAALYALGAAYGAANKKADDLRSGFDQSSLEGLIAYREELAKQDNNPFSRGKRSDTRPDDLAPSFVEQIAAARRQGNEIDKTNKKVKTLIDNFKTLSSASGLSLVSFDVEKGRNDLNELGRLFAQKASESGVDLFTSALNLDQAAALAGEVDKVRTSIGLSNDEWADMSDEVEGAIGKVDELEQKISEAVKSAAEGFAGAFNIDVGFAPLDRTKLQARLDEIKAERDQLNADAKELDAAKPVTIGGLSQSEANRLKEAQIRLKQLQEDASGAAAGIVRVYEAVDESSGRKQKSALKSAAAAAGAAKANQRQQEKLQRSITGLETKQAGDPPQRQGDVRSAQRRRNQLAELAAEEKKINDDLAKTEGERLAENAKKNIASATQFATDLQSALAKGVDPNFLARIAAEGPEKAGAIIRAIVQDTADGLVQIVNEGEAKMKKLTASFVLQQRLLQRAINSDSDQLAKDLPAASRIQAVVDTNGALNPKQIAALLSKQTGPDGKAVSIDAASVQAIVKEFRITSPGLEQYKLLANAAANLTDYSKIRTVQTSSLVVNAEGNVTVGDKGNGIQTQKELDALVARGSTGYQPSTTALAPSPNAVASKPVATVAVKTVATPGKTTSSSPTASSVTNITNFNGEVKASNPSDAQKWAEGKRRAANAVGRRRQ